MDMSPAFPLVLERLFLLRYGIQLIANRTPFPHCLHSTYRLRLSSLAINNLVAIIRSAMSPTSTANGGFPSLVLRR